MKNKPIYRIIFHNQGNIYELYARKVSQSELYAFVEVEQLIFDGRSELLVDPSEEKLKSEFSDVKRTYIPLQAVVRIDEVEKEGQNKILPSSGDNSNVTPFPLSMTPPASKTD